MAALNVNVNAVTTSAAVSGVSRPNAGAARVSTQNAQSINAQNVNAGNVQRPQSEDAKNSQEVRNATAQDEARRQTQSPSDLSGKTTPSQRVDVSREQSDLASVSVSEDGDVVAVSENGVRALNTDDGESAILREENRNIALTEEEAYEPEITSLVGYTDSQVEQLYRDGRISYNDMQQTEEQREEQREAEKEAFEEEQTAAANAADILRRQSMENIAIGNIENEEDGKVYDAMERVSGGNAASRAEQSRRATEIPGNVTVENNAGQVQRAEVRGGQEERRAEEAGRLWDYQLRA